MGRKEGRWIPRSPDVSQRTGLCPGRWVESFTHTVKFKLTTFLGSRDTLSPYSTTEESKTRGRSITSPGPHGWEVAGLGFNPVLSDTNEFIVPKALQSRFMGEVMAMSRRSGLSHGVWRRDREWVLLRAQELPGSVEIWPRDWCLSYRPTATRTLGWRLPTERS